MTYAKIQLIMFTFGFRVRVVALYERVTESEISLNTRCLRVVKLNDGIAELGEEIRAPAIIASNRC